MGIYNHIHDINDNDDYYFYCPRNDCPCHQPDYYDSSRNNYHFYDIDNNYVVNNDDNLNDCSSNHNFCGELN
jgi:hypothetical protein